MTKRICSVENCENAHRAKGYCSNHYHKYCTAHAPRRSPESRFWAKVDKTETCWNWTAQKGAHGHGLFKVGGERVGAHRYSWSLINGEIPEGILIDHICHNSSCVNPEHLRLATHKQNMENRDGAHRNSKSGVRGVYWEPRHNKWRAAIVHNKKRINVGYFDSLEAADIAVTEARARIFTHSD